MFYGVNKHLHLLCALQVEVWQSYIGYERPLLQQCRLALLLVCQHIWEIFGSPISQVKLVNPH